MLKERKIQGYFWYVDNIHFVFDSFTSIHAFCTKFNDMAPRTKRTMKKSENNNKFFPLPVLYSYILTRAYKSCPYLVRGVVGTLSPGMYC